MKLSFNQEPAERISAEFGAYAKVFEVCAEVFLNEPDQATIEDLLNVASALGDARFDGCRPSGWLQQRYYDRLFVPASPYFVPLREEALLNAEQEGGRIRWSSLTGGQIPHIAQCYEAAGFDMASLTGYHHALAAMEVDSLACELSFLAYLCERVSLLIERDCEGAESLALDITRFARWHALVFFERAVWALSSSDVDLYARTAELAFDALQAVMEGCKIRSMDV